MQERANEFEGSAGGERRLCQSSGKEKLDEAEGGGPLRGRRGRQVGGKEDKVGVGRAGPGQHIPHVADEVSVGTIKSGDTTCP